MVMEEKMIYTKEVQNMCPVNKGAYHGPAPIPEEGKWVQAKDVDGPLTSVWRSSVSISAISPIQPTALSDC
jgi:hypothetical protein